MRKQRIKKVKPLANQYFYGERGTFILFQALQWILREQVRVLIDELGFPPELEGVARDLWGLYMASTGVPNAPADHLNENEPAGSYCGPRPGARYRAKRRRRKTAKVEGEEADEEDVEDESSGQGEMTGADRTAGSGSEADDSDSDVSSLDTTPTKSPPVQHRVPPAQSAYLSSLPRPSTRRATSAYNIRDQPRMDTLLVILYLSCLTLRFPVLTQDIIHLAETEQILYLNAKLRLPADFQKHLNVEHRQILNQHGLATLYKAREHSFIERIGSLNKLYHEDWGLSFPEPNLPFIAWRLCRSMACPPLFYVYVKRAMACMGNLILEPHRNMSGARPRPGSSAARAQRQSFAEPPEFVLAATLVVVLKLVYGLDDAAPWHPLGPDDPLAQLPSVHAWLLTVEEIHKIEDRADISRLWSKEVSDMTRDDIDAYLDFFEDFVEPTSVFPNRMRDIDRFFPAPSASSRQQRSRVIAATNEVNAEIRQLYSSQSPTSALPPPKDFSSGSRPYYHFTTATGVSTLPRQLDQVLARLSKIIGTTTTELQQTVLHVEMRLLGLSSRSKEPDRDRDYLVRTGVFEPGSSASAPAQHESVTRTATKAEAARWRDDRWEAEVGRREALWQIIRDAPPSTPRTRSRRGSVAPSDGTEPAAADMTLEDFDDHARARSETPGSVRSRAARIKSELGASLYKSSEWIDSEDDADESDFQFDLGGDSTRDQTPMRGSTPSESDEDTLSRKRRRLDLEGRGAATWESATGT